MTTLKLIDKTALNNLAVGINKIINDRIKIESDRAKASEGSLQTSINAIPVSTISQHTTDIAAINNATTGILATAKSYADTKAGAVQTDLNTLSTKVGTEKTETVAATGLIKDLRQAQTDIDALELVVGNSSSGLTKQINTNTTNIATNTSKIATNTSDIATLTSDVATIKGTGVGSMNQVLIDAKAYSDTKVASLVDSAPETLNTLKELSAALGNDANFATTVSTQIGTKASQTDMTTVQNKLAGISTTVTSYVNAKDTAMGTRVTSLETSLSSTGDIGTRISTLESSLNSSSTGSIGTRVDALETSLSSTGTVGTKISTLESSMAVIKGESTVEGSMAKLKSDLTNTIANSISNLNLAITADTNSYSIALKLSDQILNTAVLQLETVTDTEINEILAALA